MTEDANRSMPPSTRSQPEEYSISLPCPPNMFAEFVAKLLGKSQLIEQSIPGPFSITKDDVVNTFHLVNQRVTQQNEAVLIQFSVKTVYQDGSAVMNNSFEDFQHYTEVRPLVSIGVHLSWIYLIKFPDKTVPEKQVIELSFSASGLSVAAYSIPGPPVGAILLRIHHTARTWGVDLESLLTNHIKGLLIEEPKWKEVIRRYSRKLELL